MKYLQLTSKFLTPEATTRVINNYGLDSQGAVIFILLCLLYRLNTLGTYIGVLILALLISKIMKVEKLEQVRNEPMIEGQKDESKMIPNSTQIDSGMIPESFQNQQFYETYNKNARICAQNNNNYNNYNNNNKEYSTTSSSNILKDSENESVSLSLRINKLLKYLQMLTVCKPYSFNLKTRRFHLQNAAFSLAKRHVFNTKTRRFQSESFHPHKTTNCKLKIC